MFALRQRGDENLSGDRSGTISGYMSSEPSDIVGYDGSGGGVAVL